MQRLVEQSDLATLRQCWSKWTRIVELFARRRPARRRVDPEAFQALRSDVLAACQALAGEETAPHHAFYQSLEGVVKPWLTPTALERADQEILNCLLAWCLSAQRQLWDGRDPAQIRRQWRRVAAGLAGVVVLAMGAGLLVRFAPAAREWLSDRGSELWWGVRRSTATQRVLAGGIALVLGAMWLVSMRRPR